MINYCSNCGNKVQEVGANFCPKCGQNLRKVQRNAVSHFEEEDLESQENSYSKINLDNLKNKINISAELQAPQKIKLGDYLELVKKDGEIKDEKIKRPHSDLPSGKELLKLIQKECSTSKEKSSEI